MKSNLFVLLMLMGSVASAHEVDGGSGSEFDVPNSGNVVSTQHFKTTRNGAVNVILRNDGEVLARPFIIDIRANCARGGDKDWKKLKNSRMQSACQIDKESITFDKANETLVIRYQDVDADDYNRQSKEPDVKSPVMKCKKKATTLRVPVSELCAVEAPASSSKAVR